MNRKENLNTDFNDASRILSESIPEDRFSEPEGIVAVLNRYSYLRSQAESISKGILFRIGVGSRLLRDSCKSFRTNYDNLAERSHEHNEKMALSLVPEVSETIGDVEGFPLDSQQTSAIAKDVHTRLVLAGAGTGKTTTIIGLAKYLILSKKAEPEDILFLSFTNATVSDLSRRMLKEVGMRLDVCTFHRLGMRILAESDGKVPRVSSIDTESFVRNELLGLMSDDRYLRDLDRYMAFDSRYAFDEDDFDNETDYQKFIKENPLVTLDGKTVKSLGEADIANWLYMHDIPYAYEEPYPVDTRTSEYGQYHPDFHIRDTNVYIEYFGVDRRGNVAPFMKSNHGNDASAEYRAGMEWKARTHSENGTTLIPLYSYQRSDDSLLDELEKGLRNTGVKVGSRNPSEIFSSLSNGNSFALDKVVREFSTAMILVKGNGQPLQESLSGGSGIRERRVLKRVVRLLEPIYNSYQRTLRDRDEIDFEDMLNLASDRVNSGGYVPAYRYVIVDEYQDISRSRYNLLRSLRESHDFKLFCVGDDWQSIYRFNGSDVNYILDFE